MKLKDKVAIITGGARGIGKGTAAAFAAEGARIALWDVDSEHGEKTVGELKSMGATAHFYKVDVGDTAMVKRNVDQVVKDMGSLDVLVNNAGIVRDASLMKMEEADWDRVISINLKGVFNCGQAAAARMVPQGRGVILNASSVVALYGNFGQTNYVAAKAGVIGMTKTWARELGRKGVRVNAVAPGFIATEMVATIPQEILDKTVSKVPLGRMGTVEDIARVYVFLASDDAAYINGAVISVDGGLVS